MSLTLQKTERTLWATLSGSLLVGATALALLATPVEAGEAPLVHPPALAEAAAPAVAGPVETRSIGGAWKSEGPGPIEFAQVENIVPNDEAVGAIHTVAAHPTNPDVLYAGTVNGGIWMTRNATALRPHWVAQTDREASLSIGGLELDPLDPRHRTLVAGVGLWSSFGFIGGARTGLLYTTNGGNRWTAVDGGGILVGKNASGVAARGHVLMMSVDFADAFTYGNIGLWRSTDLGATFTQISVGDGSLTGLPGGVIYDLVGDPNNPSRFFVPVIFADGVGGLNGVYRSDDTGASWTKVSDPAIDALLISGGTANAELAVGQHDNVYLAVANFGRLAGLFRSGDGGLTWTALDLPMTTEDGGFTFGIHPGGQAILHLSIAADPTDPDIVYVGGDRQPFFSEGSGNPLAPFFPNSIGANNFSGRLFRVDASLPAGSQAAHLTNSNTLGAAGGGTASNSSPHADSREMVFNAAGDLIETDDGGIYRRSDPRSDTGDWFSLNGDIGPDEAHDHAYDTYSDILIAGTQDNDDPFQAATGNPTWFLWLSGDGGDTAVDDLNAGTLGYSTRYSSAQGLQGFNRSFWDAANNNLGYVFPALTVVGGGSPFVGQFTTPVELNGADPLRLIIGGANSVYESFDQGDTIMEIGPGIQVNGNGRDAVSYGVAGNPDVVYVGSGDAMYVRTAGPPAPLVPRPAYPGTGTGFTVRDTVINPGDASAAYAINTIGAFETLDAGLTWNVVTGNLTALAQPPLRSIAYVPRQRGHGSDDALVVGASNGVFVAFERDGFASWRPLGTRLPTVIVFDLDYDQADDVLTAATMGRGVWKLRGLSHP